MTSSGKDKEMKDALLGSWEETYKKGQLTLWVFMALKDGKKIVAEIKDFVEKCTNRTISCEEQSLYRMLRKYHELGMVNYETAPGNGGPERKYYYLSVLGNGLLHSFAERNIRLFYQPEIKNLLFKK